MNDELLTIEDVGRILKVSRTAILSFRNRENNPLPMIDISNSDLRPNWRISREALNKWLEDAKAPKPNP